MRLVHKLVALAAVSVVLVSTQSAFAQARTFKVQEGQVQFVSDAPLEKFTGTTNKVSGEITLDPAKPAATKATIKVDAASFKTGIDLRDEHLRGDGWLDAAKFPYAEFVLTKVSGVEALKQNELAEVTVTGKFTLHGVTKEITTKAKVRWTGDSLRIQTSFPVNLKAHGISIPSIVALKVAPEVTANVDIKASAK